jgi:hypothetical protein
MHCKCANLDDCVGYGESEAKFVEGFLLIAERPYLRLYRCQYCGAHWKLDVDDRSDFAIKIPAAENWEQFDDRPVLRQFFIRFHDGEGLDKCLWAGCTGNVLKGKAICVDHAYPEYAPGSRLMG